MAKVIIGMPAYNEESYIGTMVIKCREYGEVIVVDDGSIDETARIAEIAGATVVKNGSNLGVGATVQRILSEAKERKIDVLEGWDSLNPWIRESMEMSRDTAYLDDIRKIYPFDVAAPQGLEGKIRRAIIASHHRRDTAGLINLFLERQNPCP